MPQISTLTFHPAFDRIKLLNHRIVLYETGEHPGGNLPCRIFQDLVRITPFNYPLRDPSILDFLNLEIESVAMYTWNLNEQIYTLSEPFIRYLLTLFFRHSSSAAAAYPLRGLTRCVFRDALLHNPAVIRGYLRCRYLPVSFDQAGPSPLTPLIKKAFLPAELLLT